MPGKRKQQTRPQSKPKIVTTSRAKAADILKQPLPVRRRRTGLWLLGLVAVLGVLAGGSFVVLNNFAPSSKQPTKTAQLFQPGSVSYCSQTPQFVRNLHVGSNIAFSTSERGTRGLALLSQSTPGGTQKLYQDPSWATAGNLGPIQYGKDGTLFVAPVPSINVLYNPPDEQNQIYRVDSLTGTMSRFATLPRAGPPSQENPFGVLGLGYDCDLNKLYVSSVAGSTIKQEMGRIYEVDADKGAVEAQLDNIDVLGLAVFNGAKGKRLYYGLARWPEIWSVALDDKGSFQGPPRQELSLANLGPRGSDKAREIDFVRDNQMAVHGIEFSFNLIAPTEKQETVYNFDYDKTNDKWTLAKSN